MSLSPSLRRLLSRHAVGGSAWTTTGGTSGDGLTTPVVEGVTATITGWALLVQVGRIEASPVPAFLATPGWHFVCGADQPVATGQRLRSVADGRVFQVMSAQIQPDGLFCILDPGA